MWAHFSMSPSAAAAGVSPTATATSTYHYLLQRRLLHERHPTTRVPHHQLRCGKQLSTWFQKMRREGSCTCAWYSSMIKTKSSLSFLSCCCCCTTISTRKFALSTWPISPDFRPGSERKLGENASVRHEIFVQPEIGKHAQENHPHKEQP